MLSAAYGATSASIGNGNNIYSTICSTCHGQSAANNVYGIKAGANNPTLIQSLINTNFGGMGILNSLYRLSSSQISDAASYLGSVFFPNQGAPDIASNPSSIVFTSQLVGSSGAGTTLTLSNPGTGTLIISGITASSRDFGVFSGCGANLAPGTSCFVTVTFAPSASGSIVGNLTIQTNASPASYQIALTGFGIGATPVTGAYTGLWWNPNESGWGMSITQRAAMIFVAWYTYDPIGQPAWLVMSSCPVVGSGCTGDIYNVVGGTPLGVPWNGNGKVVTRVGTGTLNFSDNNIGTLNYSVNGVNGSKLVTRQLFATGSSLPTVDYSALWWNENESGWGIAITQQYGMIFATIYTYDASGNPVWYVASSCPLTGNSCTGDLYRVTGGSAPTVTWNGTNKEVTKVGAISLVFNDSSIGVMSYTINGVTGSKAISRQLF